MARSVGEAAAQGLESGLNLGMSIANASRDRERQAKLDTQHDEDRQRLIERQRLMDQGAALDAQAKALATEGTALEAASTPPTPEVMADYARRAGIIQQARQQHLAKISGIDVAITQKAASKDIDQIMTGDLSKLAPGGFTRALTVATGQDPKLFVRPEGGMAPIEEAGAAFMDGLQSGDKSKMLASANVLFGPKLQAGVGQESPHGGKIVRKEVIDLVPDPNAKPDDPRFIPVLRVHVDRGPGFKGPRDEYGGTSSYTAPLTEGRATGPDAKVKSLSPKDVMDFVGQNLHVVELLNRPEGLAKLQEDQQSGAFDPQAYFTALQGMGVMPAKAVVKETVIPAGASLNRTTTDARSGKVLKEETIQGNPKADTSKAATTMQARLDAIDEAEAGGDITAKQAETERRAVRSGIKPGKYTGDGGGGGSGGGTIASGGRAEDRRIGRQLQLLKEDRLTLDKRRDVIQAEYKEAIKDASKKDRIAAKADYDAKMAKLQDDDDALKAKVSTLSDKLDDDGGSLASAKKRTPAAAAKPAAGKGLSKDEAAKRFGF